MNLRSGTAFGVLAISSPPPEVSAIAATSGYCLPTHWVEERTAVQSEEKIGPSIYKRQGVEKTSWR
jgi:hypothetical protein